MRKLIPAIPLCLGAMPAFAQRDFLTSDEIEKVRDVQEPNQRLKLYVLFARQRLDQFQQLMKKDKKGRSLEARDLLEDYANIIDAMDNVTDDALRRRVPLKEGLEAVASAEKKFLAQLQKLEDAPPPDFENFDIAFKEAVAATEEGLEVAQADTGTRAAELSAKDRADKKKVESVYSAENVKPVEGKAGTPSTTADGKPKRKPPTLLRPGEKQPDGSPQAPAQ